MTKIWTPLPPRATWWWPPIVTPRRPLSCTGATPPARTTACTISSTSVRGRNSTDTRRMICKCWPGLETVQWYVSVTAICFIKILNQLFQTFFFVLFFFFNIDNRPNIWKIHANILKCSINLSLISKILIKNARHFYKLIIFIYTQLLILSLVSKGDYSKCILLFKGPVLYLKLLGRMSALLTYPLKLWYLQTVMARVPMDSQRRKIYIKIFTLMTIIIAVIIIIGVTQWFH